MNKYRVGDIIKVTWWDHDERYILGEVDTDTYVLLSVVNVSYPEDVGYRIFKVFKGIENLEEILNSKIDDVLISWERLPGKKLKVV